MTQNTIKAGIAGINGRMGQSLLRELQSGMFPGLEFGSGTGSANDPVQLFSGNDVVIDFTTPAATRNHVALAIKHKRAIVIGTTGMNAADIEMMRRAAQDCPLLYSANTSIGINLLAALVEQAAGRLGDEFDIEIMETHHRNKADAPSGTALLLGQATGRESAPIDRTGKRSTGTVGYAVQRGGDVIGEHTVSFFGPGERIELSHRAHDRSLFAKGALRAAQWIAGKPAGFYSMRDVLGF